MDSTKPSIGRRALSHMWRALTRIYWSTGHGGLAFLGQQGVDRLAPDGVIPSHLTTAENLLGLALALVALFALAWASILALIGAYHLSAAVVLAARLILRAVLSVLARLLLGPPSPNPVGTVVFAIRPES